MRLAGKVAFIAGATTGIGEATAAVFAREGAHVVVTGRRRVEGEAVAQSIVDAGGKAIFLQLDVTAADQVEAVVRRALDHFGRVDVLVNNAGGSTTADGTVVTAALDEFWARINVDLFGTFLCSRFIIPEMIRAGGGSVINISSIAGFGFAAGADSYTSAKGAVLALTRSMARAYLKDGIRVNAIAPAGVRTGRIIRRLAEAPASPTSSSIGGQPLGLIEPEEVALAGVFLASDESRSMTGEVMTIHAGLFA